MATTPIGTSQPVSPIKTGDSQVDQFSAQVIKALSDLEQALTPLVARPKDTSLALPASGPQQTQWVFPYGLKAPRIVSLGVPAQGRQVTVACDGSCSPTNTVTVKDGRALATASAISGASSIVLQSAYAYLTIIADGQSWHITGKG